MSGIELIPGDELVDVLVRRHGPDWLVRMVNEGAWYPVSSIDELRQRLR